MADEEGGRPAGKSDGGPHLRVVAPPEETHERPEKPWGPPREVPPPGDDGPFPDPRTAFWLTVGGIFGTGFIGALFFGLGMLAAIGIGHAIAVGALATFAASRVQEPQAERMGLRGLDPGLIPTVLCLVPAILVVSELDNFAQDWSSGAPDRGRSGEVVETTAADFGVAREFGLEVIGDEIRSMGEERSPGTNGDGATGDAGRAGRDDAGRDAAGRDRAGEGESAASNPDAPTLAFDPKDPWTVAQALVISAGIAPVVDEFFFRGVIQQSMVVRLGLMRGVGFVALLYMLFHFPAFPDPARLVMGLVSSFGLGVILGLARAATGSVLAPMGLASAWSAIGIAAVALTDLVPLPGMNVEGTHLPGLVAAGSFALVAWALSAVVAEAQRRHAEEGFDEDAGSGADGDGHG